MNYLYKKLYNLIKNDNIVKIIFMILFYLPIHFVIKFLIIKKWGYDCYLDLREGDVIRAFSILPMLVVGVLVSIYFNNKRIQKIKDNNNNPS